MPDRPTGVGKAQVLAAPEEKTTEIMNNKQIFNTKIGFMRRQLVIFVTIMVAGFALSGIGVSGAVFGSPDLDRDVALFLTSDGIAFIIIGFVGVLMSRTTLSIGESIKEAVADAAKQNQEAIANAAKQNQEAIANAAKQNQEGFTQVVSSLKSIENVLVNIKNK